MYGMLLESIQHFVLERFGEEAWAQVLRQAGLANTIFATHKRYPDDIMTRLALKCSEILPVSVPSWSILLSILYAAWFYFLFRVWITVVQTAQLMTTCTTLEPALSNTLPIMDMTVLCEWQGGTIGTSSMELTTSMKPCALAIPRCSVPHSMSLMSTNMVAYCITAQNE